MCETCPPQAVRLPFLSPSGLEPNRLYTVLIGTPDSINSTILELYTRGYAQVHDWSPLQPIPETGYALSLMTRRRSE